MSERPSAADLKLYCAFTVRYTDDEGKKCVLMPGQVLPVWDARKLCRIGFDLDIVLVLLTVDGNGELVPALGLPAIPASRYRAALKLAEFATNEAREVMAQASLYELGGASTIAVLRPHRLPIGIGMFYAPVSSSGPEMQYEERGLNYKTAFPLVETMERVSTDTLPMPKLYVEGTDFAGMDVSSSAGAAIVGLQECMLPVCPRPVQGKHLLDVFSAAEGHLHRLHAKRVYIGYSLHEATSTKLGDVIDRSVTVQEVQGHKAPGPKLFTIPHGSSKDYYEGIKQESQQRLSLLLSGSDHTPIELVIGDPTVVNVVTNDAMECFGNLAEAAFPVTG